MFAIERRFHPLFSFLVCFLPSFFTTLLSPDYFLSVFFLPFYYYMLFRPFSFTYTYIIICFSNFSCSQSPFVALSFFFLTFFFPLRYLLYFQSNFLSPIVLPIPFLLFFSPPTISSFRHITPFCFLIFYLSTCHLSSLLLLLPFVFLLHHHFFIFFLSFTFLNFRPLIILPLHLPSLLIHHHLSLPLSPSLLSHLLPILHVFSFPATNKNGFPRVVSFEQKSLFSILPFLPLSPLSRLVLLSLLIFLILLP